MSHNKPNPNFSLTSIASPVYYTSLLKLNKVLCELTDISQDNKKRKDLINAQNKRYDNALQTVSARDHEKVIQILKNTGADVNAQNRHYYNALQTASSKNHEKVIQILINAGIDINAQSEKYNNALRAASIKNNKKFNFSIN
jgi:ankyrin repeat protein